MTCIAFAQQKHHYKGSSKDKGQQPHLLLSSSDSQIMLIGMRKSNCIIFGMGSEEVNNELTPTETTTCLHALIELSSHIIN